MTPCPGARGERLMPQLPENIIDRLITMDRRIKQLSTQVRLIGNGSVVAVDGTTGGLARPWLAMVPPQDTFMAHWPQTTVRTTFTTIALSRNPVWQPRLRMVITSGVSSGATGLVRVLINGTVWASQFTAGTTLDHTDVISNAFAGVFGQIAQFELQAQVTSASGAPSLRRRQHHVRHPELTGAQPWTPTPPTRGASSSTETRDARRSPRTATASTSASATTACPPGSGPTQSLGTYAPVSVIAEIVEDGDRFTELRGSGSVVLTGVGADPVVPDPTAVPAAVGRRAGRLRRVQRRLRGPGRRLARPRPSDPGDGE